MTSVDSNRAGVAKYGNFANYYFHNPPAERMRHLPRDLFAKLSSAESTPIACDLGANDGTLTKAMQEHFEGSVALCGVDIDPVLIERAQEQYGSDRLVFDTLDLVVDVAENKVETPVKQEAVSVDLIDTITLTEAELEADAQTVEALQRHALALSNGTQERFHCVFGFGLTMWIHVNKGTRGLLRFLRILTQVTDAVVLEPQPWKCYKSARKRHKKNKVPQAQWPRFLRHVPSQPDVESHIAELCCAVLEHCRRNRSDNVNGAVCTSTVLGHTIWERNIYLIR
ncbi:MAG: hypothetical protein MHM6MM_006545 [Cercozoa sp. M6MM]